LSQLEEEARRRIALIGLRDNERRVLEAIYAIEQQLGDARANYSEAAIRQAAEQIAALETLAERAQRYADTARAVENAFGNAFASFVTGAASARDAISGLLRNLAQLLANSAWQGLMRHTGGFGGTGVLGSIISGLFGGGATLKSADGNIFNGGNVVPFARGGVVNRPTRFPMADGRTGLMGEAGPEAIVPLKRGRNGQLGIQSEASPTREITVNVRTYVDDDAKLRTVVESISGATASRAVDQNNRHAVPALVKRTVADMRRA
jgi:lambda family phage tail tape measure protein